jgi:ActR/RegA family two-component response regulator
MSGETKELDVEIIKLYGSLRDMNVIVIETYKAIATLIETVKKVEEFLEKFCEDRGFDKR